VPRGLSARSRTLWRSVIREYELSDAEREVLRHACEANDRADQAAAVVREQGVTVLDRYGAPKAHPAVDVELRARGLFARLVAQLGVKVPEVESPRSRQARAAANARWSTHGRGADGAKT
jgi:P27 family predicted phage terminase small subunit